MWEGFLSLGGNEIVNATRAYGYAQTDSCPLGWFQKGEMFCAGASDALGDVEPYVIENINKAPWYDDRDPASARFLGVYPLSITGVPDSTATASVVERIAAGGIIGTSRDSSRAVRVRAVMSARGSDALDAGLTWLTNALSPGACGMHGDACGTSDVLFFSTCPPEREPDQPADDYAAEVSGLHRYLHDVARTSGPLIEQKLSSSDGSHVGYIVEFTLTAETPFVYGEPREISVPPLLPVVVQDIQYNLVPYPSAEVADATTVVVARNYAVNPSVEVDASSWSAAVVNDLGSDPSPYFTSERTGDIAADGSWSFRGRILGNSATADSGQATVTLSQSVPLASVPAGARVSFSIWGAMLVFAGAVPAEALLSLSARVDWMNGASVVSTTSLGSADAADFDGKVFSIKSQQIPAGATHARVALVGSVLWESSTTPAANSDIRIYADALGVTVP